MHPCSANKARKLPSDATPPRRAQGFTLIEVVIGLAITGMIMAAIFTVAQSATSMSTEISGAQERAMLSQSYVDLLRRTFEQTPGNARVELRLLDKNIGGATQAEIAFHDYPLAFSWAGVEAGAKTVILRIQPDPVGTLMARVMYLNEDQAEAYEENRLRDDGTISDLNLISGMQFCQWYFWDERTEEWVQEWDNLSHPNRRPSLVNLYLKFFYEGSTGENITFWIPTMVSPTTYVNTRDGQGGGGGDGDGPGGPDGGSPGGGPGGGRPGQGGPGDPPPGGGRGGAGPGIPGGTPGR